MARGNNWNLCDHYTPTRNASLASTVCRRHHFHCNLYTAMGDTHCDRAHNNHSPDERVMFHRVDRDSNKCPFRPMKRRLVHKCLDLGPLDPNDNWNLRTESVSRESIPFDNLPRVHKLMFVVPIAMPHVCRPMHVGNKLQKWMKRKTNDFGWTKNCAKLTADGEKTPFGGNRFACRFNKVVILMGISVVRRYLGVCPVTVYSLHWNFDYFLVLLRFWHWIFRS